MKPNYKNWIPKGMILGTLGGAVASLVLFLVFGVNGLLAAGTLKTILKIVFLVLAIALALIALWILLLHRALSYDGKRQMSKQIIDGVAAYVTLPKGGKGLDVGCGSGALTIAVAKRNPQAEMVGIDRWGAEYASYNQTLCEEKRKGRRGGRPHFFRQRQCAETGFPGRDFRRGDQQLCLSQHPQP